MLAIAAVVINFLITVVIISITVAKLRNPEFGGNIHTLRYIAILAAINSIHWVFLISSLQPELTFIMLEIIKQF